jgi:PKD domain-containing protein
MRLKAGLVCVVAVAAFAVVVAAPAGAVVMKTPNGPVGYLPLNGQAPKAAAGRDAFGNLDYHGGPVMPSNTEYAIFWGGPGSFPAGYEAGIVQYMKDVATDSGSPTNVYSVGTQYTDNTGHHAAYNTTFGASFDDTNPYPSSGNCPPYLDSNSNPFSVCVSDQNLSDEVDSFVNAHSLPRGLTNEYFVFLPQGVGSCIPDNSSSDGWACFDREFCAYHSSNGTGGATLYANESFTPIDPLGCGAGGNYPNGQANGKIDDELSSLSHEANETITDPLGTGWWDSNDGSENGDKCRTGDPADFGALLGGTFGVNGFNQIIGGRHYILQQEWSNAVNGCEQFYNLSGATFAPFRAKVGQRVEFSAKMQDQEGGRLHSVSWSFGDGHKATGKKVTHAYKRTGKYTVQTLLTNNTGLSLFGSRKIKIKPGGSRHRAHDVAVKLSLKR